MDLLYNQDEVWAMCLREERRNARRDALEEGEQRGEKKGILRSIRNLVRMTGISIEQAMVSLDIAETDRPMYLTLLEQG